jgi:hypothetical protein
VGFGSYQTLATGVGLAYFIDVNGNIVDCSGGACGNSPTTYTGTSDEDSGFFDGIEQLITDGSNVYWTDSVSVYQCPLGATCGSPLELITSSNADIGPLAVSSTEVYYADAGEFTQSIRAVAIGGGPARHVCVSGLLQDVATMVWTPEYVYFTTGEDPTAIYQCASGGGSSPTVYFSDSSPYGLAADGTNLYWTNDVDPGNVATCALGATCGASRTIASNQNDPLAIAVNATSVYWTTANAVYRATKP